MLNDMPLSHMPCGVLIIGFRPFR